MWTVRRAASRTGRKDFLPLVRHRTRADPRKPQEAPMRPLQKRQSPSRWMGSPRNDGGRPVSCHGHREASLTTGHTLLAMSLADGARTSGTQALTVVGNALASAATRCRLSRH